MKRRDVLQTGGVILAGSTMAQNVTGAPDRQFIGVAYDPVTTKIKGPVSGQFPKYREGLEGVLQFPDSTFELNVDQPFHKRRGRECVTHKYQDNVKTSCSDLRSTVEVSSANEASLTGFVQSVGQTGPTGDKTAFSLVHASEGSRADVGRQITEIVPGGEQR